MALRVDLDHPEIDLDDLVRLAELLPARSEGVVAFDHVSGLEVCPAHITAVPMRSQNQVSVIRVGLVSFGASHVLMVHSKSTAEATTQRSLQDPHRTGLCRGV